MAGMASRRFAGRSLFPAGVRPEVTAEKAAMSGSSRMRASIPFCISDTIPNTMENAAATAKGRTGMAAMGRMRS